MYHGFAHTTVSFAQLRGIKKKWQIKLGPRGLNGGGQFVSSVTQLERSEAMFVVDSRTVTPQFYSKLPHHAVEQVKNAGHQRAQADALFPRYLVPKARDDFV